MQAINKFYRKKKKKTRIGERLFNSYIGSIALEFYP